MCTMVLSLSTFSSCLSDNVYVSERKRGNRLEVEGSNLIDNLILKERHENERAIFI